MDPKGALEEVYYNYSKLKREEEWKVRESLLVKYFERRPLIWRAYTPRANVLSNT
jgi:hypothetical protein